MRRISFLLLPLLVFFYLGWGNAAKAEGEFDILDPQVKYAFGEFIEFNATVVSSNPIERVEVFYRPVDGPETYVGQAELAGDAISYLHVIGETPGSIPVFSSVEYRYRVTFKDGEAALSLVYYFDYLDNRFDWQTLEDESFRVFWVGDDMVFGQAVLDSARSGLKRIHLQMDFPDPQPIDIYVYPGSADLQSALQLSGFTLVAGHANPELGVVMVSLAPGITQSLEINRQVPHELMHIMLYQKYGSRYAFFPTWLSEGLASMAEANPDPDFRILLQDAVENNLLLPIESLCSGFRLEASLFYLSYAEAESFSRYLYDNYGASGMEDLLDHYADGVECTRAPQIVYGQSLSRLEGRWQQSLVGESNWLENLAPLVPWLAVMTAVMLVPFVLVVVNLVRARSRHTPEQTLEGVRHA